MIAPLILRHGNRWIGDTVNRVERPYLVWFQGLAGSSLLVSGAYEAWRMISVD